MSKQSPRIRRVALKNWELSISNYIAALSINGIQVWFGLLHSWQLWLTDSMRYPCKIGLAQLEDGISMIWLYRGHVWVSSRTSTPADLITKGENTKPRYQAKEQWWWEFSDPSFNGLHENMDRAIFGLKLKHDISWKKLNPSNKRETKSKASNIGVRDNRYIPQWVKIHVILRDKGACVYCGESNVKILEFDHRKAWSKGGSSTDPLNICLGCRPCNRRKSDKDWGWQ